MYQLVITRTQTGLLAKLEHVGCQEAIATHESMVELMHVDAQWIADMIARHTVDMHR
jgi:hypothetical protein